MQHRKAKQPPVENANTRFISSSSQRKQAHHDSANQPSATELEAVFSDLFLIPYNTRLCGNYCEPIYLPADGTQTWHRLCYREDFVSSALHEVAHWCIAGYVRRQQEDFGYWYVSTPQRTLEQQQEFLHYEIKPQALELLFSLAANVRFHCSFDAAQNCALSTSQQAQFARAVNAQAMAYLECLPQRAAIFLTALEDIYAGDVSAKAIAQVTSEALG